MINSFCMCPVWLVLEAMLPSLIADLKVPTISSDISTAVCCADEKISGFRPSNVSQRLATSPIVSLCLCHREILPGRCSHAAWAGQPGLGFHLSSFSSLSSLSSFFPSRPKEKDMPAPTTSLDSWNNSCENKDSSKCVAHEDLPFPQKCHTHPSFCLLGFMSRKLQD